MTERSLTEMERRMLDVLMTLGAGEVTTYGDVADVAGYPKRARFVGQLLAGSSERFGEVEIPWWRVVNAAGRLVPGHEVEQAEQLRAEGVVVTAGRVRSAPNGRFSRPSAGS